MYSKIMIINWNFYGEKFVGPIQEFCVTDNEYLVLACIFYFVGLYFGDCSEICPVEKGR